MKTSSELTEYYFKKLFPVLEHLEKQRVRARNALFIGGTISSIVSALLYFYTPIPEPIIVFFGIAFGSLSFLTKYSKYKKEFKTFLIRPLIRIIDSNLSFDPEKHVSRKHVENSNIIQRKIDKLGGSNYIHGYIDDVKIEFSDILAQKAHRTTSEDFGKRTQYTNIFKGLFIVCEFNKEFHGETIILQDSAQKIFGDLIGNWFQSQNIKRGELVKLDNIAFEKEFVVYSNDQIEARYILSPSLMEKIILLRSRSKNDLSISFRNNNIFIVLHNNKYSFEPTLFRSLLKHTVAMEYIETLRLAIGIVKELKLNQKIWSKR